MVTEDVCGKCRLFLQRTSMVSDDILFTLVGFVPALSTTILYILILVGIGCANIFGGGGGKIFGCGVIRGGEGVGGAIILTNLSVKISTSRLPRLKFENGC